MREAGVQPDILTVFLGLFCYEQMLFSMTTKHILCVTVKFKMYSYYIEHSAVSPKNLHGNIKVILLIM